MTTPLEEAAWGIIANASAGDWNKQDATWRVAAEKWRDEYHEHHYSPNKRIPANEEVRELLQHIADMMEQESAWWDDTALRDKTCREIALFCKGIHNGYRSAARLLNKEAEKLERKQSNDRNPG